MNDPPIIPSENYFTTHYQQFSRSRLYQRLKQKFQPLPFYRRWQLMRWITWVASYLFNVFSGITASTLIYLFVKSIAGNGYVAGGVTVLFILLLEVTKRKVNGDLFKDYLQYRKVNFWLLLLATLLVVMSTTFSFYGSKQLVIELSTGPKTEASAFSSNTIQDQIKTLDDQIEAARNTKWKGITTTTSQRTIELLTQQRTELLDELLRIRRLQEQQQLVLEQQFQQQLKLESEHFALFTLLLECLFLLTSWYLEYYDYRSFAEFSATPAITTLPDKKGNGVKSAIPPIAAIDPVILDGAIKNARANLSAYRSKLKNGQGTVATNKRGIERWRNKIEELEKLLPQTQIHHAE